MRVLLSCTLVIVFVWFAIVSPMRDEIRSLETHLAGRDPEIQRARAAAVALPALEREIQQLETALATFEKADEGRQVPHSLIGDLQTAASDAHVRITGLKPRTDLVRGAGAERAVELAIEGTYQGVGRFLSRLSSSTRVMNTPEVGLRAGAGDGSEDAGVVGSILVVDVGLSSSGPSIGEPLGPDASGRRDPFENLVRRKSPSSPIAVGSRGRGLASVPLADVVVRGIARNGHKRLAILETSGRQSFIVRSLDQLADSVVQEIDSSGVVFRRRDGQEGPVEIHKPVRPVTGDRP